MKNADLILYALVIAALAVGTYERNEVWKSERSLWLDTAVKSQGKQRPHANLAFVLYSEKNYPEAKAELEEAIRIGGDLQFMALNNLGLIHGEEKKYDEAISCFEQALLIAPTHPIVKKNLAVYSYKKRRGDAL
jgi:tetratricopeptide (TPR) repeat protein